VSAAAIASAPAAFMRFPSRDQLAHIPGEDGWPMVGTTLRVLKDPVAYTQRMYEAHGPVYRSRSFGNYQVTLLGPEANELVLFDREQLFSSEQGWGPILNLLFPRGLMLMDFDQHRTHRRILQVAFKQAPMEGYIHALNAGVARRLQDWSKTGAFLFYPAIKQLTLELAAPCFLGLPFGEDSTKINQAFVDMVQASVGVVRKPLPGTQMARGVAGRRYLIEVFGAQIPERRARALPANGAADMFTQLCHATDEDGRRLTDAEIIDHLNFLMMAAHDTITSSLTSAIYALGANPQWQERLREEYMSLGLNGVGTAEAALPYAKLDALTQTEYVFKEALRLNAPVPTIARRALRDFTFKGVRVPGGTMIGVNPLFAHHMPEHWTQPEKFDPLRFTPENSAGRHRFAWVPFGGGAHMCLGLHFAYMQSKVFLFHLLTTHRVELEPGYQPNWQAWPIFKPKDGLPVRLVALG
jgi:cytochrome P450